MDPSAARPGFSRLFPSAFTLKSRFQLFLTEEAADWWHVVSESQYRVSYLLLTGHLPPCLTITRQQAIDVVNDTIAWCKRLRNDPTWSLPKVSGVSMGEDVDSFTTSMDDSTFCDLLWGQIDDTPTTFFSHVRSSIRRLLSRPPENPTKIYPRIQVVPDIETLTEDDIGSLCQLHKLLQWNDRWGYTHWHRFLHHSAGLDVLWFSDPWIKEIILHALQLRDSAGWFSVFIPEAVPRQVTSDVPITIETVAFVFTALMLEIQHFASLRVNPAVAYNMYILDFNIYIHPVLGFLRAIQDGTIHAHEGDTVAAMQAGLAAILSLNVNSHLPV